MLVLSYLFAFVFVYRVSRIQNLDYMRGSVRRILKRWGGQELRKFEKNKDLNQKLLHPKSVRFFAQNQVKSKKKGLHSNLVRFFAQNQMKSKKINERAKKKVFTQIQSDFSPKLR